MNTTLTLSAVLFVAENLIHQKAVLLPWASQVFINIYCNDQTSSIPIQLILEVGESVYCTVATKSTHLILKSVYAI